MAKSAGNTGLDKYPTVNLHDLRHITDKKDKRYGSEILDAVPMQPPVHYTRPPSLIETVREQIRAHHRLAADAEMDSEEDADDFEMDDDANDPHSRYENDFEPSLKDIRENRGKIEQYLKEIDEENARREAPRSAQNTPVQSAAAPGATPPQRSGGGEDLVAAPGGPPSPAPARRLW